MRFSIHGFDQKTAVEFGLTNDELLILRHFEDFVHSGKMDSFYEEGYMYYWVNYDKFLSDLPILNINKKRLGEIMIHNLGERPIDLTKRMETFTEKTKIKFAKRKYVGVLKSKTLKNSDVGVRSYFSFANKFYELKLDITDSDLDINNHVVKIPLGCSKNTTTHVVKIPQPLEYFYYNKDSSIKDSSINDINTYSLSSENGRVCENLPIGHSETHPRACGDLPVGHVVTINKTNINKTNLTNNIYSSAEQKEEKTKDKEIYKRIVDYLNKTADKSFKSTTKKTISLIDARLKEGFTEEEFYKVIDNKVLNWLNDNKMNAYLRPETLFGNKFESYLNETPKKALKGNESVKGKTKTNNNKFANFNQTFDKYSEKELDAIIKKSQSFKFK